MKIRSILLCVCLLAGASIAAEAPAACIVPVKDGALDERDLFKLNYLLRAVQFVPRLPGPIIRYPVREGVWLVNAERRLVPFAEPFPDANPFVTGEVSEEPWSARLVGVSRVGQVFVQGAHDAWKPLQGGQGFSRPIKLARQRTTVVLRQGRPYEVGETAVSPWPPAATMDEAGIGPVGWILDAPGLQAVLAVDDEGEVFALGEDGGWRHVTSIRGGATYFSALDSGRPGSILLISGEEVVAAWRDEGTPGYHTETLATADRLAGKTFHRSDLFDEVLVGGGDWRRFGAEGLEDIAIDGPPIVDALIPEGRILDLPSIGRTLIYGDAGLYLYDGARISYVAGSEALTPHHRAFDLPTIRRAIISSATGVFALVPDGTLTRIVHPALEGGLPTAKFLDWPAAGAALVSTASGVFLIDKDLRLSPLPGGEQVALGFGTFVGIHPDTGEVLLADHRGLSVAVVGDPEACAQSAAAKVVLPESDLCLREIPGTTESDIGFAIGGVAEGALGVVLFDSIGGLYYLGPDDAVIPLTVRDRERQVTNDISPVEAAPAIPRPSGIPKQAYVLAALDVEPALFATSSGLFAVDSGGQARRLTPEGRAVRTLRRTASGTIVAGGDDGLMRVTAEGVSAWPGSEAADLGQIRKLVTIDFAGAILVDAQRGIFLIGPDDVLRRAHGISRTERFTDFLAFENARRVMTTRHSSSQSLLLELGLRDGKGSCLPWGKDRPN